MQLSDLSNAVAGTLLESFGVEACPDIDWHPAVERQGSFYQSNICDRLADRANVVPQ